MSKSMSFLVQHLKGHLPFAVPAMLIAAGAGVVASLTLPIIPEHQS